MQLGADEYWGCSRLTCSRRTILTRKSLVGRCDDVGDIRESLKRDDPFEDELMLWNDTNHLVGISSASHLSQARPTAGPAFGECRMRSASA